MEIGRCHLAMAQLNSMEQKEEKEYDYNISATEVKTKAVDNKVTRKMLDFVGTIQTQKI